MDIMACEAIVPENGMIHSLTKHIPSAHNQVWYLYPLLVILLGTLKSRTHFCLHRQKSPHSMGRHCSHCHKPDVAVMTIALLLCMCMLWFIALSVVRDRSTTTPSKHSQLSRHRVLRTTSTTYRYCRSTRMAYGLYLLCR